MEKSAIPDGPVVLDASVALAAALEEPAGTSASALLAALAAGRVHLLVPALFDVECASGLAKAVRRGRLDHRTAALALVGLLDLPAERVTLPRLHREALDIALLYGVSVHDAEYVALATASDASLVTADAKLGRALRVSPHEVWLLEDLALD